jgi:hypothetical protein
MSANHTPEPWGVEEIDNEGEYGSGPDTSRGFQSFAICDVQGRALFDSLNRDVGVSEIHEDGHADEDGYVAAWDDMAKRDAHRIVACVNACAPIETSELEEITRTGGLLGPREDIARLAAQRDELLSAARAAEAVFAAQKWRDDSTDPEAVALRLLREAIVAAEVTP